MQDKKKLEVGSDLEMTDVSSRNMLWGNHQVFENQREEQLEESKTMQKCVWMGE